MAVITELPEALLSLLLTVGDESFCFIYWTTLTPQFAKNLQNVTIKVIVFAYYQKNGCVLGWNTRVDNTKNNIQQNLCVTAKWRECSRKACANRSRALHDHCCLERRKKAS